MSKEIAEEYASSLSDLTINSKPLINMLTILAEENIDHAEVIVDTVEKHVEKVPAEIKLPVLYLVDSIIKNVGGAYTQKFSQSIVNMFTRTFKLVDEKTRSQMFKLRETWHDVFPATKLYQLDVKVNLIDPAWPIQAQPQQSNIHVNPNFLKKPMASASANVTPVNPVPEDEKIKNMLAKKEQELLMLQRKKIEMELEQARKQLEITEKNAKKGALPAVTEPVALDTGPVETIPDAHISVKQRLGPPVNKLASASRITPVSGPLVNARRDPRLARRNLHSSSAHNSQPPIAPNVFDIKPLERGVSKRKNVITIDVRQEPIEPRPVEQRRDPRLDKRREKVRERRDNRKKEAVVKEDKSEKVDNDKEKSENLLDKIYIPDTKKMNKLPPIPKLKRSDKDKNIHKNESPDKMKRKNDKNLKPNKDKKKKRDSDSSSKDSSSGSPDKKYRNQDVERPSKVPPKDVPMDVDDKPAESEVVIFKELKNYHKERYMRRNKEKSPSPDTTTSDSQDKKTEDQQNPDIESSNVPDVVVENKDVDLRLLPTVPPKASPVSQKRSSTELPEVKTKKTKLEKFDILFGNEDVDLRKLPQVEELCPPPPSITKDSQKKDTNNIEEPSAMIISPEGSPNHKDSHINKKDWSEVKVKEGVKNKTLTELDLVRAKLAEATKGKDRLGRPFRYSKSPSIEKERRRTISSEDTDLRVDNNEEFDTEDNKKTISIIMSQAKEEYDRGKLDKSQYNTLMYQVLQLNEKLKLKEAKQKESLEISKRKLKAHVDEDKSNVKLSPKEPNRFGDIDERVIPAVFSDNPLDSQKFFKDLDMRVNPTLDVDGAMPPIGALPMPPMMPGFPPGIPPFPWRGQMPRMNEGPRRGRGQSLPFGRVNFDKGMPRPPFDGVPPFNVIRPPFDGPPFDPIILALPVPKLGIAQGKRPYSVYNRSSSPPPLGHSNTIPPTDLNMIEYVDQDPVKTIQIDGIPREIRFYDDTAVIMLDWDDPREIKFLPGSRRVTFDNKDSVVLSFNEPYRKVEIEDQVFDIRYGAPTRELFINGRWFECFFGGQPFGVMVDGKPRLIQLEGPLPQVDIGKEKRTDLVAGKINLIVDATQMYPIYLDAKLQKFLIKDKFFTIRFVDSLKTVLINEQPFSVEFGDLPKPIFIDNEKHFIRFSTLPRQVRPGYVEIANMEGTMLAPVPRTALPIPDLNTMNVINDVQKDSETELLKNNKSPSPERDQGLDILASVMPIPLAPSSGSEYSSVDTKDIKTNSIPGLENEVKPTVPMSLFGNINVNDLFAKLVATGIVQVNNNNDTTKEVIEENKDDKTFQKDDKSVVHKVDLLKPESLRSKQPALVTKLYGGMQCSGCGTRFPPEQTVRYSQHLDWHFRQNRRERDSARKAHSRHWHYDLPDWKGYEELEDLDEREKNWFETVGAEGEVEHTAEVPEELPSVAAGAPEEQYCALCGDKFDQFYNEDKEEWHLRKAVKHEGQNYHPLCFDDYKASLAKEELPAEESIIEVLSLEKQEQVQDEPIDLDMDDEGIDNSDCESVVEVSEEPKPEPEPVEIDEGDEDDVVYKEEPVEQIDVDVDYDTDDETKEIRNERDKLAEIDFSKIKIKQEPIDPDDEPVITAEEEAVRAIIDTTQPTVLSSIDGNVQLESTPATTALPGIRINISKTIPSVSLNTPPHISEPEDVSADDEPQPPGEELEIEFSLKPELENVEFSKQPLVKKGSELSGLCCVM